MYSVTVLWSCLQKLIWAVLASCLSQVDYVYFPLDAACSDWR